MSIEQSKLLDDCRSCLQFLFYILVDTADEQNILSKFQSISSDL